MNLWYSSSSDSEKRKRHRCSRFQWKGRRPAWNHETVILEVAKKSYEPLFYLFKYILLDHVISQPRRRWVGGDPHRVRCRTCISNVCHSKAFKRLTKERQKNNAKEQRSKIPFRHVGFVSRFADNRQFSLDSAEFSNVLFASYNLNFGCGYLRPYNRESTASRLICEVKHVLAVELPRRFSTDLA